MAENKGLTLPQITNVTEVSHSKLFTVEAMDLTFSNGVKRQYERVKGGGARCGACSACG